MVVSNYARTLRPPNDSFFLFGIRGVGKSTWARQRFPNAPRVDLLDEGVFQSYLRDPPRFGQEVRRHTRGTWVVVDEVQRLPALLNEVHRAIEDLGLRFVLLGSSARRAPHKPDRLDGYAQLYLREEIQAEALVCDLPGSSPSHFAGLRAIGDLVGITRRVLVHTGERAFDTSEGIEALPVMQFAQEVLSGKL